VKDADGSLRGPIEMRDGRLHVGHIRGIEIRLAEQLKAKLRIGDHFDMPGDESAGQNF